MVTERGCGKWDRSTEMTNAAGGIRKFERKIAEESRACRRGRRKRYQRRRRKESEETQEKSEDDSGEDEKAKKKKKHSSKKVMLHGFRETLIGTHKNTTGCVERDLQRASRILWKTCHTFFSKHL